MGLVSFTHRSVLEAPCVVVSVSISLLFTPDHTGLGFYPLINVTNTAPCMAAMSILHANLGESVGSFASGGVGAYEWKGELM